MILIYYFRDRISAPKRLSPAPNGRSYSAGRIFSIAETCSFIAWNDSSLIMCSILHASSAAVSALTPSSSRYRVSSVWRSYIFAAQMPQLVGNEIAAAFEQPDRAADARLGITHVLADIYRAHILILLGQNIYRFEIHLTRFLQIHLIFSNAYNNTI